MNILLLSLVLLILISIVLLLLFNNINKKSFIAEDGSLFNNQSDLEVYQKLYEKTKPLFSDVEDDGSNQSTLGFEKSFLTKLTTEGFNDLKTLVNYRKQFKLLSDLINI